MSEFLNRKVRTFFKHLDHDGDGFISKKDMEDMVNRYCDAKKATDSQKEDFRNIYIDTWRKWNKSAGTGDSGVVTPSTFIESMKQQKNDPEWKASFQTVGRHFFSLMDLNGDGYLQEDECLKGFLDLGFQDVSFIPEAFESMDVNKDGKVSLEEYSTAIAEYLTSEDENSPYTIIFGPLV